MPARTNGLVLDRQSGRCRIACRDGSLAYFYRAVVEADLGRHLRADEQVHHLNGDPSDDRLENLEVLSIEDHGTLHGRASAMLRRVRLYGPCAECGEQKRRYAHGKCRRCYQRLYMRRRREATA